jgi:hypothetical protein
MRGRVLYSGKKNRYEKSIKGGTTGNDAGVCFYVAGCGDEPEEIGDAPYSIVVTGTTSTLVLTITGEATWKDNFTGNQASYVVGSFFTVSESGSTVNPNWDSKIHRYFDIRQDTHHYRCEKCDGGERCIHAAFHSQ